MNVHTILVPTDFSPPSQEALRIASSLARESGAKVVLAHVWEVPRISGESQLALSFENPEVNDARRQLANFAAAASSSSCEQKLLRGNAADEILQTAADVNADLIVIGTHGRNWLANALVGSVAAEVLRRAECPVLSVKGPRRKSSEIGAEPIPAVAYPPVP